MMQSDKSPRSERLLHGLGRTIRELCLSSQGSNSERKETKEEPDFCHLVPENAQADSSSCLEDLTSFSNDDKQWLLFNDNYLEIVPDNPSSPNRRPRSRTKENGQVEETMNSHGFSPHVGDSFPAHYSVPPIAIPTTATPTPFPDLLSPKVTALGIEKNPFGTENSFEWKTELSRPTTQLLNMSSECKATLNFYNEDRSSKTMLVEEDLKASDLCHLLVLKNHATEDKNWVIVEHLGDLGIERSLEDHEIVLDVYEAWEEANKCLENKFYLRKDFRKYEIFQNPEQFFPNSMLESCDDQGYQIPEIAERNKKLMLQNLFTTTDCIPELHGCLYLRDSGKKSWKKMLFILRKSGLYFSSKGISKEPRHLVLFSQFTDENLYFPIDGKKDFHTPTDYCFCIKPANSMDSKDIKCLCAEDERSRMCWVAGIRLLKYGKQLRDNYKCAVRKQTKLKNLDNTNGRNRPLGENPHIKSRVAMDFTGNQGRVVEDPNEAVAVAVAEGHEWKKKSPSQKIGFLHTLPRGIEQGVHITQPWFHSCISREEATELITKHGLVDGVFLARESHSVPGAFVLSFAHNQKVKHYQISAMQLDNRVFYTLDDGMTKFSDLLQMIEFYQLNAGSLPTSLKHYVIRLQ